MKSTVALLFWGFLFAGLASARAESPQDIYRLFPVLECPAVGDEYEKMISKLESIKAAIKQDANCAAVILQVKNLEDLVVTDRAEVMEVVDKSQDQPLTDEQATKVRQYAENVTKKVAALNDLFLHSNQCFKDDHADQQLSTLAGFVNEASSLVGSLTGPWGAPIALAGNVIAGFMTGLDQVLKSRAGFDFSKREQWTSYVQNLCTYHSYRDQIDHLLNPQAKISQLKELKSSLDTQIQMMTRSCAECQKIETFFNSQNNVSAGDLKLLLHTEVDTADHQFVKPFGTYTLQSLGLREWVIKEMARIEKEAQSYWSDVSGRQLLYRAKDDIEQFLLVKEAPLFLAFQTGQGRDDFANFQNLILADGRGLYNRLEKTNAGIITHKVDYSYSNWLDTFRALVISPLNLTLLPATDDGDDLKYTWTYFRDQSLMRFRTAQNSVQVVQSFCSFIKHSGNYSAAIRGQCSANYLRQLVNQQNLLEQDLTTAAIVTVEPGQAHLLLNDDAIPYSQNRLESLTRAIHLRATGN